MSRFPARFTGRWDNQDRLSYDDAVCWHVLLGGGAAVRSAVATARQRLAGFTGLHMTPPEWLHVTILRAGTADQVRGNWRVAGSVRLLGGLGSPGV